MTRRLYSPAGCADRGVRHEGARRHLCPYRVLMGWAAQGAIFTGLIPHGCSLKIAMTCCANRSLCPPRLLRSLSRPTQFVKLGRGDAPRGLGPPWVLDLRFRRAVLAQGRRPQSSKGISAQAAKAEVAAPVTGGADRAPAPPPPSQGAGLLAAPL